MNEYVDIIHSDAKKGPEPNEQHAILCDDELFYIHRSGEIYNVHSRSGDWVVSMEHLSEDIFVHSTMPMWVVRYLVHIDEHPEDCQCRDTDSVVHAGRMWPSYEEQHGLEDLYGDP